MFTMATAKALKLANSSNHKSGHKNFQNSLKSNFGCFFSPSWPFFSVWCEDDLWLNFNPQRAMEIFDLTTSAPTAKSPVYLRNDQYLVEQFGFCSKNFQMCKVLSLVPKLFAVFFAMSFKLGCCLTNAVLL